MAAGSKSVLLWLALLAAVVLIISSESVIARELGENSNVQLEQHNNEAALGEEKLPIGLPFKGQGPKVGTKFPKPHKPECPPGYEFCPDKGCCKK